jgi:acyl-CoA reductase-like NAD-dependent aldehyde dehydrogenase
MARLACDAGIPNGVINVVTGAGSVVGAAMIEHPLVDMISFTGSTRAGTEIGAACARLVKRAGLELGGKAANVVFADADIDDALDGALLGTILNAGQECVAGTRILVERKIAKDFTEALAERAKKLRVGMPLDPEADLASVIHEGHMHSVLGHIELARREGAKVAVGGGRKSDGAFEKGFFIHPTVLCDVAPSMTYFKEEVFDTVEDAVALANDTTYGLGNGLWTKELDKALQVSKQLKSGTVWVNTYLDGAPQMPFGGYKRSGLGRENGIEGLTEFMDVKSTFIRLGKRTKALAHTAI